MARNLENSGFRQAGPEDKADLCFINTCTVTSSADKKSRQAIKKIKNRHPDAFIIVTGCYVQLNKDNVVEIPGVDLILGNNEKFNIQEYLPKLQKKSNPEVYVSDIDKSNSFSPSFSLSRRTRSFLKIQDGCDYNCSYCTIPHARGPSRNNSINKTISVVKEIANTEVKEIVLSGVNVGDFGKSTNENFLDLISELDKINGIDRYRISSIEPDLLSDSIIDFVSNSNRFMPHFHIPLQSGTEKILKLMRRRYNLDLFSDRIEKIHSTITNACVGIDIITGFPGESDEDFMTTYNFLKEMNISYFHVFSYSDRENTSSNKIYPKTESKIISERSKILQDLGIKKKHNYYCSNIGLTQKVLFENQEKNGKLSGHSTNYIKTEIPWNKGYVNTILSVKYEGINENGNMTGEVLTEN